jgi:hypothetical protein
MPTGSHSMSAPFVTGQFRCVEAVISGTVLMKIKTKTPVKSPWLRKPP